MPADRQPESTRRLPPLSPMTAIDFERERAAMTANAEWAIVVYRAGARSASERLRALQREGRVLDETHPMLRR